MFESNWPPKCFLFWTQVCESLSLPYRRPRGRVGLGVRRRLAGGGRQNDGERPAEARLWAAGRAGLLPGYQEHLVGTPGACCHHHHVGYILVESEITGYPSWITVTVHRSPVILYLNWGWDPAAFLLSWCTRIGSERLWRRGSWLAAGLRHLHLRFQSAWNGSLSTNFPSRLCLLSQSCGWNLKDIFREWDFCQLLVSRGCIRLYPHIFVQTRALSLCSALYFWTPAMASCFSSTLFCPIAFHCVFEPARDQLGFYLSLLSYR